MNNYIATLANGQLEEWNSVSLRFVGSWVILADENGDDIFAHPAHRISHIEKQE